MSHVAMKAVPAIWEVAAQTRLHSVYNEIIDILRNTLSSVSLAKVNNVSATYMLHDISTLGPCQYWQVSPSNPDS